MPLRFDYNKRDAQCRFCERKRNPHPEFDETIATKIFNLKKGQKIEVCINCFEEMTEIAKSEMTSFEKILAERENLLRVIKKASYKL